MEYSIQGLSVGRPLGFFVLWVRIDCNIVPVAVDPDSCRSHLPEELPHCFSPCKGPGHPRKDRASDSRRVEGEKSNGMGDSLGGQNK